MIRSAADAQNPPTGVWTHLAGVFNTSGDTDSTNDTIQLFVNGRPRGSPVRLAAADPAYTPAMSTEDLLIGRAAAGEYLSGQIDELTLWQSALTEDAVREDSLVLSEDGVPAAELVASWDSASATDGSVAQQGSYGTTGMTLSATGEVARPEGSEVVLDGESGYLSAQGPAVDETGSFTVTARVKLDRALREAKPIGYRGQVLGQETAGGGESSWALWVEKIDPDQDGVAGYCWYFGRTATDTGGRVVDQATVESEYAAELDTWVQVTGVYDANEAAGAGRGSLHRFVNGAEQAQGPHASFSKPVQGVGTLSWGRGSSGGQTGNYLPGVVGEVRIWVGALDAGQLTDTVLSTRGAE